MEGYMNNLLSANISNATAWGTILVVVLVIFLVIFFAIIAKFFKTWLRARLAKAPVSMSNMLGMWLRKVPYPLVVDTRITAAKAGLDISTDELEAHFLAGGDIVDCVLALIAAEKAGIPLSYDRACAIDLAVKGTSKGIKNLRAYYFNGTVVGKISCRNHPGIIQDKMIPFPHIFRQIAKMPVLNHARIPVNDHHPGRGAVRKGTVRYQFFRQRIIKINGAHGQVHCHESSERSIPLNRR